MSTRVIQQPDTITSPEAYLPANSSPEADMKFVVITPPKFAPSPEATDREVFLGDLRKVTRQVKKPAPKKR